MESTEQHETQSTAVTKEGAQEGQASALLAEGETEAKRAFARAREAFVKLAPRLRRTSEKVVAQIKERPAMSAVVAGGAALGLAAAVGAAEVAVGFAGAYAIYKLVRGERVEPTMPKAPAEKTREKGRSATV